MMEENKFGRQRPQQSIMVRYAHEYLMRAVSEANQAATTPQQVRHAHQNNYYIYYERTSLPPPKGQLTSFF